MEKRTVRKNYDAFLSHNSKDKPIVEKIAHWLTKEAGLTVWLDKWNLVPGDPWQEEIEKALDQSRCCVIFLGPHGGGTWHNMEMRSALNSRVSGNSMRVLPVLLPGAVRPGKESELPRFLRELTWVVFKDSWQEDEALRLLVCGIEGKEPGPSPIEIEIEKGECPFRGLEIFREQDRRFYFGRERLIERLLAQLEHSRFLCVAGPSGCGKSSMVQAGLLPPLRERAQALVFTPRMRPLEELAFALCGAYINKNVPPAEDVLARLNKSGNMLHMIGREIIGPTSGKEKLLIVIDQFEELFTQTASGKERQRFIELLLEAVDIPDGPVTVILTLRSDFIGKCAYYKELNMFVIDHLVQVEPMDEAQLRRVIEEPARLVGLSFDEGLVNRVLTDIKDATCELPLLEHALLELFEKKRGNRLTSQAYETIGGIAGALVNRAEAEYAKLDEEEKEILRNMFVLRLIQPGEGTEDTRRRASREELLVAGKNPKVVEKVLNRWIQARLLTGSRDAAGKKEMVDVAHEALIRRWDRMAAWMAEDREASRLTGALRRAALEWQEASRNPAYLFHGIRLARMEGLLESFAANLTPGEIAFVRAGVEQREAIEREKEEQQERELQAAQQLADANSRAVKRARVIMAVVILGLISVLSLLYNVNIKEKNTRRQLAINYWDASRQAREKGDRLTALHLNAGAVNINPDPVLRKSLLFDMNDLWNCYVSIFIFEHREPVNGVISNADDTRILIWSDVGTACLWDGNTGNPIGELMMHKGSVNGARFNKDETLILTWSVDNTARLWESATGKSIGKFMERKNWVTDAIFNKDETLILTWSIDNTVRLWDGATGKTIWEPMKHEGEVNSAILNADKTRILTWSRDKTARLLESATSKSIGSPMQYISSVDGAIFNKDETRILTWSLDDGTARFWDANTGKPIGKPMVHDWGVRGAIFNTDESRILTWSNDGTARLWEGTTGKSIGNPMVHEKLVDGAIFNTDESRILTWSWDGSARLWDGITGKAIGLPMVHEKLVDGAIFNADESRILTWSDDGTARLWEGANGKPDGIPMLHGASVSGAMFNPDGTRILTWGWDGTTRLWDGVTGHPIGSPMVHKDGVNGAIFNADESRILTWSEDNTARLWDGATGNPIGCPMVHEDEVSGAIFNADESRILTWSGDLFRNTGGAARLWDGATGNPIGKPMKHKDWIYEARFNTDGTRILTWSGNLWENTGAARLWDGFTGNSIGMPMEHQGPVWGSIFNTDETRILTWSLDNTARLWDAASGKPIGPPMVHEGDVYGATFNKDETRILTWSQDGTAKLWDVGVDWDFPPDKIKLQVMALTATEFDRETREVKALAPDRWYQIRDEYIKVAREHLKTCKYPQANVYRKLNLEKVWSTEK